MRENYTLTIVAGTNQTGKTTLVMQMIEKLNQRGLIINPSEEHKWNRYEKIKQGDLKTIHSFTGIKQISPKDDFDTEDHELYRGVLREVYYNYRGGTLVIDDFRMFVNANVGGLVTKLLIKRRQNHIDAFCICHSVGQVPPKVFDHSSHLILFKTNDDWKNALKRIGDANRNALAKALRSVNHHPDLHYHQVIQLMPMNG